MTAPDFAAVWRQRFAGARLASGWSTRRALPGDAERVIGLLRGDDRWKRRGRIEFFGAAPLPFELDVRLGDGAGCLQ